MFSWLILITGSTLTCTSKSSLADQIASPAWLISLVEQCRKSKTFPFLLLAIKVGQIMVFIRIILCLYHFWARIHDVSLNYTKEKPISDNLFVSGGIKKVQNCVQVVFEGTLFQINPILIVLMLKLGVSFLATQIEFYKERL